MGSISKRIEKLPLELSSVFQYRTPSLIKLTVLTRLSMLIRIRLVPLLILCFLCSRLLLGAWA
jgi:hypothetical protein